MYRPKGLPAVLRQKGTWPFTVCEQGNMAYYFHRTLEHVKNKFENNFFGNKGTVGITLTDFRNAPPIQVYILQRKRIPILSKFCIYNQQHIIQHWSNF